MISVGDKISCNLTDRRSWWERHAPLWLGGRHPPPTELVVTAVLVGKLETVRQCELR